MTNITDTVRESLADRFSADEPWMDLNALAPKELRDEIREITSVVDRWIDQAGGLAERFVEASHYVDLAEASAVRQYRALVPDDDEGPGDSIWNLVNVVTGYRDLFNKLHRLSELVDPDRLSTKGVEE